MDAERLNEQIQQRLANYISAVGGPWPQLKTSIRLILLRIFLGRGGADSFQLLARMPGQAYPYV